MCGYSKLATWDLRRYCLVTAQVSLGVCLIGGIIAEAGNSQPQNAASPSSSSTAAPTSKPTSQRPLLKLGSQGASVTELQGILSLLGYYKGSVNGLYDEKTAEAVAAFQKAANLTADGIVGADTWIHLLPPAPPVVPVASVPLDSPVNQTPVKLTAADSFPIPGGTKPNTAETQTSKLSAGAASKPTLSLDRSQSTNPETAALPILRLGMKGTAVEGLQKRLRALGFLSGTVDGIFGPETQAAVKLAQRKLKLEPDGVVGAATWMAILQ